MRKEITLGAIYLGGGRCEFRVWAPHARKVEVHLVSPQERTVPLDGVEQGYHEGEVEGVPPGALYLYRLDGEKERPDPASRYQPQGVHKASQVVDPAFPWTDSRWFGLPLEDYVIYELHAGTFTAPGTFEAILAHLEELKDLGITAVELMPVAQFPGNRNWGYDGVYPFAVQDSYGGPTGFKTLVDACHQYGLAVILDVVYNHLGPEGNYLRDYGPYFTGRYKTPWGEAVNFDGPHNDEVRRFFIENALYWVTEFHVDALRIDAIHAILDFSARPFLEELARAVQEQAQRLNRKIYLVAESDLNDTRSVRSRRFGGYALDAQWNDDFHHALHTLLTGEREGYYQDFGKMGDLAKAFREGFIYSGEYSPYRRRRHGNSSRAIPAHRFVVFAQNHDQVGNRMLGERLSSLVSREELKLAAGVVLLSPFLPLLFMGEEYGETAPFQYFISHTDPGLVEAVRRGRREEFSAFRWKGEIPDPQSEETFLRSKLNHRLRREEGNRILRELYRELIRLRRTLSPLASLSKENLEVRALEKEKVLYARRWRGTEEVFMAFHFGSSRVSVSLPVPEGSWRKEMDSEEEKWKGRGCLNPARIHSPGQASLTLHPGAFALFSRTEEA
jgi:maltooligosyltrehalose trehalohydrolase